MTRLSQPTRNIITWKFQLVHEGSITRYGVAGPSFYKQYLPGGVEFEARHPPRRIDQRHYEIATRASLGMS